MTTLIFGIGIGLFIILLIWLIAGLIFAISLKTDKKIGLVAITIATLLTFILIYLPKNYQHSTPKQQQPYDQLFIVRITLVGLLAVSSVIGVIGYVRYSLMETNKPEKIVNWNY